ncbi:alpha/beta hydrolase [Halomicrobium salinisoli]|uniref:alpha/beta hydrolase n=1 Tax=Halomicrobium salinisoli TaxID=2878391 RepID=UPI001CF055B7|nr:alpha/beta hydrolase [Halomicrobium salinisoli]
MRARDGINGQNLMTSAPPSDAFEAARADTVHPAIAEHLAAASADDGPSYRELSLEEIREMDEESPLSEDLDIPVEHVEDRTVPGPDGDVPVRLYDSRTDRSRADPVIVYIHGGGWISGSIETHNRICRNLTAETGYPVVSVGYRLAPEDPFPAGLRDCYAVLEWIATTDDVRGIDPERTVVMGDSAGGNLAAATALLARDRDGPDIAHQVLIYPAMGGAQTTLAYRENSDGYGLTAEIMDVVYDRYTESDIDDANYYAWPRKSGDLSGLPPATILTAGFDPLRDVGALYADQLRQAEVPVSFSNYPAMVHGFFAMIGDPVDVDPAHEAYEEIATKLRNQFD